MNLFEKPSILVLLLSSTIALVLLVVVDVIGGKGLNEIGDGALNDVLLALALLIPTGFVVSIVVDEFLETRAEAERLQRWKTVRRLAYGDLARALLKSGRILEEAAGVVDSKEGATQRFELAYEDRATRGLEGRLRVSARDFFSIQYPSLKTSLDTDSTNRQLDLRVRELSDLADWNAIANSALQQVKEEMWQVVARWAPLMVQVPDEARKIDAYSTIVLQVKGVADLFFSDRDFQTVDELPSGQRIGEEWSLLKAKLDQERVSLRGSFRDD